MTNCIHCGCYIDPGLLDDFMFGENDDSGLGTKNDPMVPGDYNNICVECNYVHLRRGGPFVDPTYTGDYSEWE